MNHALPPDSTKHRILNAAESLFSEHGFEATSLRRITTAASVNLAAVNYHFQSKEALLDAVVQRRATPINQRRYELLEQYETGAAGKPVAVEQILDALLRPVVESGVIVPRLLVRLQSMESSELFKRIFDAHLKTVAERFAGALLRSLPEIPPTEVFLRMHFVIGAFVQLMAAGHSLQIITEGRAPALSPDAAVQRLIRFAAAGLKTPAYEEAHAAKS
ncbi:MAG TPA: TetR/AcrR family transcriptional regulator [Bryobacteraceae bacterium]|nr:TetR/AcrR family transcriptional regulator [Bryobacteraceae bacterium]